MKRLKPWIIAVVAASLTLSVVAGASAQGGPPSLPSVFLGTVTADGGPVAADVEVAAFIGDVDCSSTHTTYISGGASKYIAQVAHESERAGCGTDGAEVRFRVGNRWATQTGTWSAGAPQTLNLTLAPEGPETATVHVAVWRSTSNPANLYLSTRPEGGTWTTHDDDGPLSMSEFGTGRFERSDDLIAVDVVLE